MPLYFDEFTDLALDWPMILVGWRGFAGRKLSAEQVVSHAADLIGQGTPEQDEIAALLANADPSEWQTIDRYLEQILEDIQIDRATAIRKWRLSEFKYFLGNFPRPRCILEYSEDESLTAFEDLFDFWLPFEDEGLPESAAMILRGDSTDQMLAEQQAWIEREETALRERIGAKNEHSGNRIDAGDGTKSG